MKDKNIKVILVEDDPFWQKNISMYIEKEADDIEVIKIVDSKEKVLEIVENESQIDIVLMDINLTAANLDGIEIIEILSKQKIKAIALTSISEQDVI
ncbi:response regulator, partial [Priestia megaterium]